jgi:hypothetical protein
MQAQCAAVVLERMLLGCADAYQVRRHALGTGHPFR